MPATFPTIQSAIDASSVGDTVLVGPGTYLETLVIPRRLALVSEGGAMVTAIDAAGQGTVVLVGLQGEGAIIDGFRITNGYASSGAHAGGIHVDVDFGRGGRAIIKNNIVEYNRSIGWVGGIFAMRASTVQDNLIQHNNQSAGKAVSALEASGIIRRNIIRFNGDFGDLHIVMIHLGPSTVEENLIVNNGAATISTLSVTGSGSIVRYNTVANNLCGNAVVEIGNNGSFEFRNNIITYLGCDGLSCFFSSGVQIVRCNDASGSAGNPYAGDCADDGGTNGNISADPLFCDTAAGDYRLQAASPCASANSPPGCGLIGALPVCGATGISAEESPIRRPQVMIQPNPVSAVTEFVLDESVQSPTLEIYDSAGRLVDLLHPISSRIHWMPPANSPRGVYFARLRSEGTATVVKFVVER